jgi:eukaryotic-like serine/threonine-protein kinase
VSKREPDETPVGSNESGRTFVEAWRVRSARGEVMGGGVLAPPDDGAPALSGLSSLSGLDEATHRPPPPNFIEAALAGLVQLEEIGRGGMGTVHRARDTDLLRDVAMKMLDPAIAEVPKYMESFIAEAQITGQLGHPNIVPVHKLGIDASGRVYFTMKLVNGVSLHEWLEHPARGPGSYERLADGLEIFMKVCDAMSFAHSRGVVHRDLKPANVMVGDFGEVYVMDWGLARLAGPGIEISEAPGSRPAERAVVGTPAYMSPEQASGRVEDCDHRSDVFGLGAILYQMVTGCPPYPSDLEDEELYEAVREGAYTPPEMLCGASASKRLLNIVKKALSREREDRYPSAAAMKRDVQRFLRAGMHLPQRTFAAGTSIVVQGEPGDEAFIIMRGECVAYKTVNGERRVLRRMFTGDVFGELSVLSNVRRTATVLAVDAVTVLAVSRSVLEEGIGLDTWLGALIRALATRFNELDQQVNGAP